MVSDFFSYWQDRLKFIDIHYHVNPDTYTRRFNALQAGYEYQKIGGGVILKSHLGCTCAVATTAQSQGFSVFGSVVLNDIAGGIDLRVIKQSLSHYSFENCGRLIVHLPTIVTNKHRSRLKRAYSNIAIERYALNSCTITDGNGKLLPVIECLIDFCQDENIIISTGHSSRNEVEQLVDLSAKKGGVRLMLNQPANPITGMDAKKLKRLGNYDWLYIEQTALTVLLGYQDIDDFYEVLGDVNNAIYSSDLGQTTKALPDEWLNQSKAWFKDAGLSLARINELILTNSLTMLAPGLST